jgi:hypothetical protein
MLSRHISAACHLRARHFQCSLASRTRKRRISRRRVSAFNQNYPCVGWQACFAAAGISVTLLARINAYPLDDTVALGALLAFA